MNNDSLPPLDPTIPVERDTTGDTTTLDELKALVVGGFRAVKADFQSLYGEFGLLRERVVSLERKDLEKEERLNRNSDRAKHPSEMDLELKAAQGLVIAKNIEQDKKIDETHTIVVDMKEKLTTLTTAGDARAKVLDSIASTVDLALKSKMMEKIGYALGGAVLLAIAYYIKKWGLG